MLTDLDERQRLVHDKLVKSRGGLVLNRVGSGKTRTSIEIFATLQKELKWELPCVCLVVCRRLAFHDWRTEIRKIGYDWHIYEDEIGTLMPPERLLNPCFLFLSEGMLAKKGLELSKDRRIKFVILDEGYLYKNHKSAKGKAANTLTKTKKSLILSGSVMTAKNLGDVWGIALAVNKHRAIAPCRTKFVEEYLHCDMSSPFPSYYPKPGAYKKLMDKIEFCTDVYFPANNKRKITEQIIRVPATPEQLRAFKELKSDYGSTELQLEFNSILAVTAKVQQIANGWVEDKNGRIRYIPSNKVEAVCAKIEELYECGERVVVWCAFRNDVALLASKLKFATLQMLGGQKFDTEAWATDRYRVCLATEASGSSVNHFANTPYAIYFSTNYKWLDLQQSMGRTDRGAASRHAECFYYFYQVEKSLDAFILHTAKTSGRKELTLIKHGEVNAWLKNKS